MCDLGAFRTRVSSLTDKVRSVARTPNPVAPTGSWLRKAPHISSEVRGFSICGYASATLRGMDVSLLGQYAGSPASFLVAATKIGQRVSRCTKCQGAAFCAKPQSNLVKIVTDVPRLDTFAAPQLSPNLALSGRRCW